MDILGVLLTLFRRQSMNTGQTVFAQLMEFIPRYQFQLGVDRYPVPRDVKDFSRWDQLLCLAFAQLSDRSRRRDIETSLRAQQPKFYLFTQACAFFITRAKKNVQFNVRTSRPLDRSTGLRCDQTLRLTGILTAQRYPDALRRIV